MGGASVYSVNKYLVIIYYIVGTGHAAKDRDAPCSQGVYSPVEMVEKPPVISGCGRGRLEVPGAHCWVMRQTGGVLRCILEKAMPRPKRWGWGGVCSRQVGHREQKSRDKRKENPFKS